MKRYIPIFAAAMIIGSAGIARATPYAFASNNITGLTITNSDGTDLTFISSATTNISDSAQFGGFGPSGFQNAGLLGNALTINQAYSGPGPAPAASFTPVGPGNFTGTRAHAAIGAGTNSSGGVSMTTVAEGYGSALGNSNADNGASITVTVMGAGQAVTLSFSDAIDLIASTAAVANESATAGITSSFTITQTGSNTPLATFEPATFNQQVTSQAGVPPTSSVTDTSPYTSTTPVLTSGITYTISFSSQSSEQIIPSTTSAVPEPASLTLLGIALFGSWLLRPRQRRTRLLVPRTMLHKMWVN
jgi:PEP-CTERM motif